MEDSTTYDDQSSKDTQPEEQSKKIKPFKEEAARVYSDQEASQENNYKTKSKNDELSSFFCSLFTKLY